jgi:hypothetical protein
MILFHHRAMPAHCQNLAAGAGMGFPSLASQVPKGPVRFAKRNAPAFAPSKGAVLRLDDPAILIEELGVGQSVLRSALIIRGLEVAVMLSVASD